MPLDLSRTLVVGISSTALFNLKEADRMFQELREEDPDEALE
jgi:5'-nucleotidase